MKINFEENKPYQVVLKDHSHFVGYFLTGNKVLMFRNGTDDKLIILLSEIRTAVEISPRDVETRKTTGKFFIY